MMQNKFIITIEVEGYTPDELFIKSRTAFASKLKIFIGWVLFRDKTVRFRGKNKQGDLTAFQILGINQFQNFLKYNSRNDSATMLNNIGEIQFKISRK